MINRIKGVLLLDSEAFKEVEHDEKATGQAALIVVITAILAAIGASSGPFFSSLALGDSPWNLSLGTGSALVLFLGVIVWSILAWLVWAASTYFIGTKIFHGKATYGEMLRVTGFAYAPLAFLILGAIPCIGFAISLIISVWALASVFIGIREGLDLDVGRTLVTVIVGWLVYGIGMGILGFIFSLF
jgi:hypothetical protein